MKIQKKHINSILLIILSFSKESGIEVSGLLLEKLGMGAKRKLQKIRKELLNAQIELNAEIQNVQTSFKGIEKNAQDRNLLEEVGILLEEDIIITSEPVLLSEIEKIESKFNYDFELIEMISQ